MKPIEDTTVEEWDSMMRTNLIGAFIVAKAVGKHMIKRRNGKIINISSIAGTVFNRINYPGAYETSKEGIKTLTKCLDANWNKYNINVNAIEPGYFLTDVNIRFYEEHPRLKGKSIQHVPCGRIGEPDELGPLCVLLASDGANYMHGSIVRVDGGRTYW
jgi:NAD(P)-dependent dehydrogenase (short-subunit alcohol dehydrogenase family)